MHGNNVWWMSKVREHVMWCGVHYLELAYSHTYYIHAANYIDGKEFLKLTVQDIKDMIPAVGIAKKIERLVPQVS